MGMYRSMAEDVPAAPERPAAQPAPAAPQPAAPRSRKGVATWLVVLSFVCLVIAAVPGAVFGGFWVFALVPFIVGIVAIVRGRVGLGATMVVLAIVAPVGLSLALGATFAKRYRVPSPSMEPTLAINSRVLVNKLGGDPAVGDIVVLHPPAGAASKTCGAVVRRGQMCSRPTPAEGEESFVKRVVAGPGDQVALRDGQVVVNGRLQREPYIHPCASGQECNFPRPIRVPAGYWFMLGDNRGLSDDSRFWGPVPSDWIVGTVYAQYWPLSKLGSV
jgi:signal peptidase I